MAKINWDELRYAHAKADYWEHTFHTEFGWVRTNAFEGRGRPSDLDDIARAIAYQASKERKNPYAELTSRQRKDLKELNAIAIKQAVSRMIDQGMTEGRIRELMADEEAFMTKCNEINPKPPGPIKPNTA